MRRREIAAGPHQLRDELGLGQEFAIDVEIEDGLVVHRDEMPNEIRLCIRKILGASSADRAMHCGHLVDRIGQSEFLARVRQTCRFFGVIGREHRPDHVTTGFAAAHGASGLKGNRESLWPVHDTACGGVDRITLVDRTSTVRQLQREQAPPARPKMAPNGRRTQRVKPKIRLKMWRVSGQRWKSRSSRLRATPLLHNAKDQQLAYD